MFDKINSRLVMWITVAIAFGIALSINGCATYQAHPEGHMSFDDIAVLHRSSSPAYLSNKPNLRRIDGKDVGYYGYAKFELTPGKHRFSLNCEPRFSTIYTILPAGGTLEFNMEAGHQYHMYCDITDAKLANKMPI